MIMKNFSGYVFGFFMLSLLLSCDNNERLVIPDDSILPENFKVDLPGALSYDGNTNGRMAIDPLDGNIIYGHLANFIHVGEEAAQIVEDIIQGIVFYRINRPMELSFESDDDGRVKNLVVMENRIFDGKEWEYQLTLTDLKSEAENDGGKAIQIFWNRMPVEGIAILKPYNIDRTHHSDWENAVARIDYSEAGELGYEAHMIVQLAELPLEEPLENPYSMQTLKMFAGKSGNTIDLFGNSDHPNALFFSGQTGYNWAFVASGDAAENIGVAEVGLPPSILDNQEREILLKDYAIKNVFNSEINAVWPDIDQQTLETFLNNTDAPGYFSQNGFVSGGESPGSEYDDLTLRLPDMIPYNPTEITALSISFKE
jgi:hypothetical protein